MLKTTYAQTRITATCTCPYCDEYQWDIKDKLTESDYPDIRYDEWEIEVEITCDDCWETFVINELCY